MHILVLMNDRIVSENPIGLTLKKRIGFGDRKVIMQNQKRLINREAKFKIEKSSIISGLTPSFINRSFTIRKIAVQYLPAVSRDHQLSHEHVYHLIRISRLPSH